MNNKSSYWILVYNNILATYQTTFLTHSNTTDRDAYKTKNSTCQVEQIQIEYYCDNSKLKAVNSRGIVNQPST